MISVIIPLYNKEAIIERTLRSVLSQDYDDYEVVLVDDGSTDKSLSLVEREFPKIKREFDVNTSVEMIQQVNSGPSKARNTGARHAKGEWIVFLDADDEFLPGALKRFDSAIKQHPKADFIACPFYNDNGSRRILMFPYKDGEIKNPFKSSFFETFLPRTGAFVCKKDLLIKHPFNECIRRFEDLELLYRLYRDAHVYTITESSMVVNTEFAAASHGRKDIKEDFLGHLDFCGKGFWEKMCLYQLFLWERPHYPAQCKKLYPSLYRRWDMYFIYQIITRTKRLWG